MPDDSLHHLQLSNETGAINPQFSDTTTYQVYYISPDTMCPDTFAATTTITIGSPTLSNLTYASGLVFCKDITQDTIPNLISPSGGNFYVIGNTGLVIDSSTGTIYLSQSPTGLHTIQYVPPTDSCRSTIYVTVEIRGYNVSFSYGDSTFCTDLQTVPISTINSAPIGIFSANPPITGLDSLSGAFHPNLLSPSFASLISFTVTDPACPAVFPAQDSIRISQPWDASFSLDSLICLSDSGNLHQAMPTISQYSGIFSSQTGLFIDSSGVLDLTNSPPGNHAITYQLTEKCPSSSNGQVILEPTRSASFNYPDSACQNGGYAFPNAVNSGGTFKVISADSNSLVMDSTGRIDLAASNTLTYVLQHTSNGPCPEVQTDTLTILPGQSAYFRYEQASYCTSDSFAYPESPPSFTSGGKFYGDTGSVINQITGEIDLLQSLPGYRYIPYDIDSIVTCPSRHVATIKITERDIITSIAYDSPAIFCRGGSPIHPDIRGLTTGQFFNSPPGIKWRDRNIGEIVPEESTPGTYTIKYQLGLPCEELFLDTITIADYDTAYFSYAKTRYCQNDPNPLPDSIYTPGGQFSTSKPNISIVDSTGLIDLANSIVDTTNGSKATTFWVYYSVNEHCPNIDSFQLTLLQAPQPIQYTILPDSQVCENTPISFEAFTDNRVDYYNDYLIAQGNNRSYIYDSPEDSARISMIYLNDNGCQDSIVTIVRVHPYPHLQITEEPAVVSAGKAFNIRVRSDLNDSKVAHWGSSRGLMPLPQIEDTLGPLHAFEDGVLALTPQTTSPNGMGTMTIAFEPLAVGCVGEADSVLILVMPEKRSIFIPTVMTPNGDEINDTWEVHWTDEIDPKAYRLLLYNPSGGLVYEMDGLNPLWNGSNLPEGVYWWNLLGENNESQQTGGLTIRRK
ncbi:MAG TPA: gliding motility-associated C-terminal domain-containing protein [Bacteroidetes bacterium]|nr:gliding motility-associated C-terminal domain-containing protein [Bacteroidota bacterium]